MKYEILLLTTLEPCWLWWLILSAIAFLLGAVLGCLLCSNKKKLQELEAENAALGARCTNWEKDYVGLKYQFEQAEIRLKELRAKLNSCEADKQILESKLARFVEEEGAAEGIELASSSIAAVVPGLSSDPEDLKIIEGIGPKIEELLKAGGIQTWQELADAPVDRLQEILQQAGERFRLAKPDSWPQQAALAAAGQWETLQELQDRLQGGVDKG